MFWCVCWTCNTFLNNQKAVHYKFWDFFIKNSRRKRRYKKNTRLDFHENIYTRTNTKWEKSQKRCTQKHKQYCKNKKQFYGFVMIWNNNTSLYIVKPTISEEFYSVYLEDEFPQSNDSNYQFYSFFFHLKLYTAFVNG